MKVVHWSLLFLLAATTWSTATCHIGSRSRWFQMILNPLNKERSMARNIKHSESNNHISTLISARGRQMEGGGGLPTSPLTVGVTQLPADFILGHHHNYDHQDDRTLVKLLSVAAEKTMNLAFTYLIMRVAFAYVKAIVDSLGDNFNSKSHLAAKDRDLKPYLFNNHTLFNSNEKQLLDELTFPEDIAERWDDIGGLGHMKTEIWSIAERLTQQQTKKGNETATPALFQPIKSFLLFGPPGCGKTVLGRGLASRMKWPVLSVTPSSILRPYVGESSMQVKSIFTLAAKMKYCIVLIDEMDALFSSRSREMKADTAERQVKTEFMQLWDELKRSNQNVLIIGMTNRVFDLDPAIQRRFERSFRVDLPDFGGRVDIFKKLLRHIRKDKNFDYLRCGRLTDGFAASDIFELCKSAIAKASTRAVSAAGIKNNSGNHSINATSMNTPNEHKWTLRTQDIIDVSRTYTPLRLVSKSVSKNNDKPNHPDSAGESAFWRKDDSFRANFSDSLNDDGEDEDEE